MTTSPSSAFSSASAWLDDRMGAILVKEARQAVRSRFVVSIQFLFLTVLVITLAAVLLGGRRGQIDRDAGREVFLALNVMLHAVCVVCVPFYVGVRMAAERGESNVDLMFSTTLRPMSIVWGKVASGLLVGLLAVSACAPFMVLCYFLRGVDVPTVVFCILVDLAFLLLATVVAVFIGALPVGWVIKGIVALVYGGVACASVGGLGYEMPHDFIRNGQVARMFSHTEGWIAMGNLALCLLAAAGLFFMVASAMIAPPTANRALPVRGYLTGLWAVSGVVAVLWGTTGGLPDDALMILLFVWAVIWSCVLALGLIVAASERDALGARMRRSIPESALKRKFAFLFYSGAAGGLAWTVGMLLLTLGVAWGGIFWWTSLRSFGSGFLSRGDVDRFLWRGLPALGLGFAMLLAYMLLAVGIRRHLFARFTRSLHTGVIGVVLMVAGMLLPLLMAFLLHGGQAHRLEGDLIIHAFNPFALMFYFADHADNHFMQVATYCLITTVLMLAVGVGLSGVWFLRQVETFGVFGKPRPQPQENAGEAPRA